MKYAIISDIHGNIHAFEAVLADAVAQGVSQYLLLGDYTSGFPYGNDVVNTMRRLTPCTVIRGNGEGYLIDLMGKDPAELTNEQFKPVYWAYRSLSADNLDYLAGLPESITLEDGGANIFITHQMPLYFRKPKIALFHPGDLRDMMQAAPFAHEAYLARAKAALLDCPEAVAEMDAMPAGIYLSGHNHLQFYMKHGGKLFINPGSCGEPLDWDVRAAYTILTVDEAEWRVDERRVSYDWDAAAEALVQSGFASYAPVWTQIMEMELRTAKDEFTPFVMHLMETAKLMGQVEYPVNNKVWQCAVSTWRLNKKLN